MDEHKTVQRNEHNKKDNDEGVFEDKHTSDETEDEYIKAKSELKELESDESLNYEEAELEREDADGEMEDEELECGDDKQRM